VKHKVIRQLERSISIKFLDIQSIDFGSDESTRITPGITNTIFQHNRILLFAFLKELPIRDLTIHLENGNKIIIEKSKFKYLTDDTIHLIGARSIIRDLEEGKIKEDQSHKTEEIISIAENYNLMSKETSFVAVIENKEDYSGPMKTLDIPIPLPRKFDYDYSAGAAIPDYDSPTFDLSYEFEMSFDDADVYTGSLFLIDITSLSIGIDLHGKFVDIIPRSTMIPTRKSKIIQEKLTPTAFTIRIFQG